MNNELILRELTKEEQIDLVGGEPTEDTSLAYDLAYYIVKGVK